MQIALNLKLYLILNHDEYFIWKTWIASALASLPKYALKNVRKCCGGEEIRVGAGLGTSTRRRDIIHVLCKVEISTFSGSIESPGLHSPYFTWRITDQYLVPTPCGYTFLRLTCIYSALSHRNPCDDRRLHRHRRRPVSYPYRASCRSYPPGTSALSLASSYCTESPSPSVSSSAVAAFAPSMAAKPHLRPPRPFPLALIRYGISSRSAETFWMMLWSRNI